MRRNQARYPDINISSSSGRDSNSLITKLNVSSAILKAEGRIESKLIS